MKLKFLLIFVLGMAVALSGCVQQHQKPSGKPQVITTLFPLYDFARTIAGTKADVRLLLPPGVEAHNFEPRPDDIVTINKAQIFIYTNRYMEPWAAKILSAINPKKLQVVDAGEGVKYLKVENGAEHEHDPGHQTGQGSVDPHIWLDFDNSQIIVRNILAGFVADDPPNADYYRSNAAALSEKLTDLDRRYRIGLASCSTRVLLHGGHFTFGYLARRYELDYRALSGVSSESEPSAIQMADMAKTIKKRGVHYLFTEELLSPRLAETLAAETGVGILKLHGAHNVSKEDLQHGVTFIDLMELNLKNLQKGLACREK
ncbi:MAG TPA: zinc ABC transporter substrate-binding protein [Desulfuromonadaceae bacterium]|jgi:zinc transport system substrate-binding protein